MVSKSLRHFGEGSVTEEFHDGRPNRSGIVGMTAARSLDKPISPIER